MFLLHFPIALRCFNTKNISSFTDLEMRFKQKKRRTDEHTRDKIERGRTNNEMKSAGHSTVDVIGDAGLEEFF